MNIHQGTNPIIQSMVKSGVHCSTCQCSNAESFFQWKNPTDSQVTLEKRVPMFMQSRVIPHNNPEANEVGHNVIPNKTVWFKSVSPRPSRITIKVSSPDRPNLRPSEWSSSLQKRAVSTYSSEMLGLMKLSRAQDVTTETSTPLKKLVSRSTMEEEVEYSPQQTPRKA